MLNFEASLEEYTVSGTHKQCRGRKSRTENSNEIEMQVAQYSPSEGFQRNHCIVLTVCFVRPGLQSVDPASMIPDQWTVKPRARTPYVTSGGWELLPRHYFGVLHEFPGNLECPILQGAPFIDPSNTLYCMAWTEYIYQVSSTPGYQLPNVLRSPGYLGVVSTRYTLCVCPVYSTISRY